MKIRFYNRDSTTNALKDADSVIFRYIKRIDTDEIIVPDGTPMVHFAEGIYEYEFIPSAFTSYEYQIEWSYGGTTNSITSILLSTASNLYPSYSTLAEADSYFEQRLHSQPWYDATNEDKIKALITATRIIDTLRFSSRKVNYDQATEFPRIDFNPIPEDIKSANNEIAFALIDGSDPESDYRSLRVTSRRYSSVGTNYDTRTTPLNVLVGVPSLTAWNLLQPYLAQSMSVNLHRVS
jgi:hypothetical protein